MKEESTYTVGEFSGETLSEALEHGAVADHEPWLLARIVNYVGSEKRYGEDSRQYLEEMGISTLGEHNDLFYEVEAPEGWTKSTSGFWTKVHDAEGVKRMSQFYKGASHERRAFMNIIELEE